MKENKGIQLLLAKWVKFPDWIKKIEYKKVKKIKIKSRCFRLLEIKEAQAKFDLGSSVSLKLPEGRFVLAFRPLAVLEIRDLRGNLLQRNRFLCEECFENSGKLLDYKPSQQDRLGNPVYQCSLCGAQWQVKDL